jgi:hypothetical protein
MLKGIQAALLGPTLDGGQGNCILGVKVVCVIPALEERTTKLWKEHSKLVMP